jgi:lipid-A-disaccharide synthase
VHDIARYVDRMIVIFPFEEEFYRRHNVPVTYVGHPLIEQLGAMVRPERNGDALRIALLPGSRRMEVQSLLPPMLDAVAILRRERKVDARLVLAPTIDRHAVATIMNACNVEVPIVEHDRGEAVAAADVALSSSGTATLEAAILGTPVVVMYRLSAATYMLARRLVRLPHFSLVNIVAGKRVVPELIQNDVNGARIAEEVRNLVAPGHYEEVCASLAEVRGKLGTPGAARRVAEEIHKMVRG